MRTKARTFFIILLSMLAFSARGGTAFAVQDYLQGWNSVGDDRLDDVRGGYLAENGLEFSFGLVKTVVVNGVPLVVNTINFGPGVTIDPVSAAGVTRNISNLIQGGSGNSIDPTFISDPQSGVLTFIQNTLDRAVIQNSIRVDASVTVRGLFRDLLLSSTLRQQLINSVH